MLLPCLDLPGLHRMQIDSFAGRLSCWLTRLAKVLALVLLLVLAMAQVPMASLIHPPHHQPSHCSRQRLASGSRLGYGCYSKSLLWAGVEELPWHPLLL